MRKPHESWHDGRNISGYDDWNVLKITQPYRRLILVLVFYCGVLMCAIKKQWVGKLLVIRDTRGRKTTQKVGIWVLLLLSQHGFNGIRIALHWDHFWPRANVAIEVLRMTKLLLLIHTELMNKNISISALRALEDILIACKSTSFLLSEC